MGDVVEAELQQLLGAVADRLTQRAVDPQPTAIERDERHPDRRIVKPAAQHLLGLATRALGLAQLRDVLPVHERAVDAAVREAVGREVDRQRASPRVGLEHHGRRRLPGQRRLEAGQHELERLGPDERGQRTPEHGAQIEVGEQLALAQAEAQIAVIQGHRGGRQMLDDQLQAPAHGRLERVLPRRFGLIEQHAVPDRRPVGLAHGMGDAAQVLQRAVGGRTPARSNSRRTARTPTRAASSAARRCPRRGPSPGAGRSHRSALRPRRRTARAPRTQRSGPAAHRRASWPGERRRRAARRRPGRAGGPR